jgi:hypothetical protein
MKVLNINVLHMVWFGNVRQNSIPVFKRGSCGRDCMVVGFTTTCTISAYHHNSCKHIPVHRTLSSGRKSTLDVFAAGTQSLILDAGGKNVTI